MTPWSLNERLRAADPAADVRPGGVRRVEARLGRPSRTSASSFAVAIAVAFAISGAALASYQAWKRMGFGGVPPAAPLVRHETPPPVSTLDAEVRALEGVLQALRGGDVAAANAQLDAYDRAFPEGLLQQEAAELTRRATAASSGAP